METQNAPEISPGIFQAGIRDWNRTLFDVLIPLPVGTSYNSYVVKGARTAVIDSCNPGFEAEWAAKVSRVTPISEVDYLVMNHAEPDHAGAIPYFLEHNKKAKLVASEKGAKMAQTYFDAPTERLHVVKEGDSIDLGGKTLRFLDAQWLHWPEVIFTYVPENGFLSSCDFFGAHTAFGLFDDEVDELPYLAKAYFGEIMMPYRSFGKKALEKVLKLDVKMIGPSHGPVYRAPKPILDAYAKWTSGETLPKVVVAYVSMWNHTEAMVKRLEATLADEGVIVSSFNLATADTGKLAAELVDARAVVLGSPAVLGGMHPMALYGLSLVKALKPPVKYAAVLSSYGWAKSVAKPAVEMLSGMPIEIVGAVEANGPATEAVLGEIDALAKLLAVKIKGV